MRRREETATLTVIPGQNRRDALRVMNHLSYCRGGPPPGPPIEVRWNMPINTVPVRT